MSICILKSTCVTLCTKNMYLCFSLLKSMCVGTSNTCVTLCANKKLLCSSLAEARLEHKSPLQQWYSKDKTEQLCNGKTVKNDRRNDCNWLILVLKDTWHYEKDWENTHIFVKMLFSFWGDWKWKYRNHKNTKFSKLRNFAILLGQFFYHM